jgi:pyrroloquinoline quinone biosynthesis protein D
MMMIAPDTQPKLARGVRLREDPVRGGWNLLAPERVLRASDTAAAILALCDGTRSFTTIVDTLVLGYQVERERIEQDTAALLEDLAGKGMVEL